MFIERVLPSKNEGLNLRFLKYFLNANSSSSDNIFSSFSTFISSAEPDLDIVIDTLTRFRLIF